MKILTCLYTAANAHESLLLRSFHSGIEKYFRAIFGNITNIDLSKNHNISLNLHYDSTVPKCDLAIQFGAAKPRANDHHVCRQSVRDNARHIMHIETPFLGRTISAGNKYKYYRVGVDGYLNGQDAFLSDFDLDRSNQVLEDLDLVQWQGWNNTQRESILVLLQLPGDTSLRNMDMGQWCMDVIERIRAITNRKIVVRLHPAMSQKGQQEFLQNISSVILKNWKDVYWSSGHDQTLEKALKNSSVCISHSSGSAIDAILQGVPVITTDQGSLAYPISSHFVEDLVDPKCADSQEVHDWLCTLAQNQWTEMEMRQGLVWRAWWEKIQDLCSKS